MVLPHAPSAEVHSDLAEALYLQKPKSLDKLTTKVCKKWTKACTKANAAAVVKHERKDETFKEMDEKAKEMEDLMRKMNKMGMGGMSMYSRDDMDEMMEEGGGMEGLEDEF